MPVSLTSVTEWPLSGKAVSEEKWVDWMYCDLYSGAGLKRLGDGQAVGSKEGGEIKEGSSNLGGRGRGAGLGGEEVQQGAPP